MGILRGLDSRLLSCGCLIGIYETYSGKTLSIVDARGERCRDGTHRLNNVIPNGRVGPGRPPEPDNNAPGCRTT